MNVSSRRYEPFHSSECQSYKRTTARTTQRKQSLFIKRSSNKSTQDKQRRKSFSPSKSSSKVGDYILTNVNISSRLCKAVNEITRKEYTCQYIEISKYRETLLPYTLVSPNENVNNIIEILYGKKYVYFIFEESFGDLHSYIRSKKKLKEHEACSLFQQIVNVVKHCHKVGVVIRDLKLRKFVFKDPSRTQLKLETLDSAHVINKNCTDILYDKHGCPAYVSPEILESTNGYSSMAADVWSLGVIIYTMLIGRYPFHDQDPTALFVKIKNGHFVMPEYISASASCLIHSILRKLPTERLTADELTEHPWFNADLENLGFGMSLTRMDRKKLDQLVPDVLMGGENFVFGTNQLIR